MRAIFVGGPKDGLEWEGVVLKECRFPVLQRWNLFESSKGPSLSPKRWMAKYTWDPERTKREGRPVYVFDGYEEVL